MISVCAVYENHEPAVAQGVASMFDKVQGPPATIEPMLEFFTGTKIGYEIVEARNKFSCQSMIYKFTCMETLAVVV